MRKVLASLLVVAWAAVSPASAAAGPLLDGAVGFIGKLEAATGMKIAVLDRIDRTEEFWARSAAILCQKTGEDWCTQDVMFMTSNTEPMGQSHIIQYVPKGTSTRKLVCAVIPPMPDIDPSYVGEAFGTGYQNAQQYPTTDAMAAWLMLYHAAHCLDTTATVRSEDRATAFATLGLGLMQGAPEFTPGINRVAARKIGVMTGNDAAYWAAGAAERVLLDYWKDQVGGILRDSFRCVVTVVRNTSVDVEKIRRDGSITSGENCSAGGSGSGATARGTVSDANLWVWMYANGGLGAPPEPYQPFDAVGGDNEAAAAYVLRTANQLSGN